LGRALVGQDGDGDGQSAAKSRLERSKIGLPIGAVTGALHRIVWLISGEWILTWPHRRANGGTIIFWRTVYVGALMYGIALGFSEWISPETTRSHLINGA
jgi:hypothetical protein